MQRLQLYIATSLDGYIATPDGGLDWLENFPNPQQLDYGYTDFYAQIDTVIMGRATYEMINSFGIDWPYANCTSYIVTTQKEYPLSTPNTHLLPLPLRQALLHLQQTTQKNIWLVGGGKLVATVLSEGLIDDLLLTLIPALIGDGIPLWEKGIPTTSFELVKAISFDTGVVQLHYQKNKSTE